MGKINRILIANRGEIALRIIRACRKTDKVSILVYSSADSNTKPVAEADEAVCIGPAPADQSYLSIPALLTAARLTNADGIHPGYGFLSENAEFAHLCEERGLIFIGPSSKAISQMGDKASARSLMKKAGVPVIPGSDGVVNSYEEALAVAEKIGYPVLIKATAGGGGKGMRLAENREELEKEIKEARQEAGKAFGNDAIYLSQRRHQKLIEESPSPLMTPYLRKSMCEAAKKAALACHYSGAGTIEFIVTPERDFYFMEMNTRIQVEHGVTEEATGTKLVETMISIADGKELPWKEDLTPEGWTMECRINAEDPLRHFAPSPGRLIDYRPPYGEGIRVDSAMRKGAEIPPYYDSMIAKLIVHGKDREDARNKMLSALDDFKITGVKTTIPLHRAILSSEAFIQGEVDTMYVEHHLEELLKKAESY